MVNSNTSFGKLKEIIVGRELEYDSRTIDLTIRLFYKENLLKDNYEYKHEIDTKTIYKLNKNVVQLRNIELDNLAKILEQLNIKVYRPKKLDKLISIKTPFFTSNCNAANNVRDITFIYNNKIIETPIFVRDRYFENTLLYDIFNEIYDNGKNTQWIKSPNVFLTKNTIDLDDWKKDRDFLNIPKTMQMAIDGAQFLRIGKDVIVNIATYNHYLGLNWIKSFFPKSHFHIVKIADNHIDGSLLCLKPGVFLVHPKIINELKKQLPKKFQKWKFIVPENLTHINTLKKYSDLEIQLASSEGMDLNILSIDEKTILVNKRAVSVIKALEKEKFNVIPIELNNCELFGGGIHCSTLDTLREDEYIEYA